MANTATSTNALKFLLHFAHLESFSCSSVLASVIINLVKVGAEGFAIFSEKFVFSRYVFFVENRMTSPNSDRRYTVGWKYLQLRSRAPNWTEKKLWIICTDKLTLKFVLRSRLFWTFFMNKMKIFVKVKLLDQIIDLSWRQLQMTTHFR